MYVTITLKYIHTEKRSQTHRYKSCKPNESRINSIRNESNRNESNRFSFLWNDDIRKSLNNFEQHHSTFQLTRTWCFCGIGPISLLKSVLSSSFLTNVLSILWQCLFWHKRIGLSFLQPIAVFTWRVDIPIPQLSEHDVQELTDEFWQLEFTIYSFHNMK